MKRSSAALLPLVLSLALSPAASGSGQAFRVRSFANLGSFEGLTGDREPGSSGAFWFAQGGYDQPPSVVRLTPEGAVTTWTLDADPRTLFPVAVRRLQGGVVWTLVYRQSEGLSFLYRLDTATNAVRRVDVPFRALRLEVDPISGAPVVAGAGKVARFVDAQSMLFTFDVPDYATAASRPDASGRLFLEAYGGAILGFTPSSGALERWSGTTPSLRHLDVAEDGTLWAGTGIGGQLVRFRPGTSERTDFSIPLSQYPADGGWVGLEASGGWVTLSSYNGPSFLEVATAQLTGGTSVSLGPPAVSTLTPGPLPTGPDALTATRSESTVAPLERVVYAESDGGRHLYQVSGSPFNALLWAGGGEALTSGRPVQWWRPLAAGESFATEAALPVAVEVRPSDPTNNFLTEVSLTNVDADSSVSLTLKTSSAEFVLPVTLEAGRTRVFPNVVQSFRESVTGFPAGGTVVAGTLTARFTNGRGTLQARVFTRFADSTKYPAGSTTGLAFGSVDPAREPFVFRRSLNGLKNTARYRTNVAVANLCGVEGTCPTLDLAATFFDDATGERVGETVFSVPPHEWQQKDVPLTGFPNAVGETFSVLLVPFQAGTTAYDAYATVIDNDAQDGAFIRASSVGASSTLTVPVVTDRCGATCFTSEVALTNTTAAEATADATYTSVTGATVTEAVTLGSGRGLFWPNAVDHFRQLAPGSVPAGDYGSLRIAFRNFASGFASSRTTAANGTGLGFTAVDPYGARSERRKRLYGLKETSGFRTNLAVVHLGATGLDPNATVTVKLSLTAPDGSAVGTPRTRTLSPGELFQWNRVLSTEFGVTGEGYVATVERTDGLDGFEAYATVIDETTQDPTFVRAE